MSPPSPFSALTNRLPAAVARTAESLAAEVQADRARLPVAFPGLPRRTSRDAVRGGRVQLGHGTVDLDAFRVCDLAAAQLLLATAATENEIYDIYQHGDLDERAMLLRALHFLPVAPITTRLFAEVQRTNMVVHLEAAICDGDLFSRSVGQHGFDLAAANRLLLKVAFLDLPLRRLYGAERHANPELSRMLQDLATEREAAGRAVWRDTNRMIARAPVPGTVARLLGGLEHGDDATRLAAAEGLLTLNLEDLRPFAVERLAREPRADVRTVLQQLAGN